MVSVLVSVADPSAPKPLLHKQLHLEARVGIEPTNAAFAEPCLTTWLPRHQIRRSLVPLLTSSKMKFPFNCYFFRKSQPQPLQPEFSRFDYSDGCDDTGDSLPRPIARARAR